MTGLIIAAPRSGSGKTVVTLGLLRHLVQRGMRVTAAKAGPDYVDPGYLSAACRGLCINLDTWAMRRDTLARHIARSQAGAEIVLCEGVMGMFDGVGESGAGSTAELAAISGWPVLLVVDVSGQAQSVAALVEGFMRHRRDVALCGVILNRVGSARHAAIVASALRRALPDLVYCGALARDAALDLPSRHLGLVPAGEHGDLDAFLDRAAAAVGSALDVDTVLGLARPSRLEAGRFAAAVPPLGQHIAVARDEAFAFAYPSLLDDWREAGAALSFFSPLADEAPSPDADAVYLPGGYPELYAGRISGNRAFIAGMDLAAQRGSTIYGECGGYMVLGRGVVDAAGTHHAMTGLLPVETSFAERKLHLGYRVIELAAACPLGASGRRFRGHEFHYASVLSEGDRAPLFTVTDAEGASSADAGCIAGKVMGSFLHLVDRVAP